MIFVLVNLLAVAALVGLDQLIKFWVSSSIPLGGGVSVIPGVVELRFIYNQGMAFSMLSGRQTFLVLVTAVVLAGVAWYLFFRCRGRALYRVSMILILSGGLGNLIDRVLSGQVVDYINLLFMHFAVFNFADICVCVGVGLLILCILLDEAAEKKKPHADGGAAQ